MNAFVNRNNHRLPNTGEAIIIRIDGKHIEGIWENTRVPESKLKKGDSIGFVQAGNKKYHAKHGERADFLYFKRKKELEL